jgi:hypothetical protein
MTDELGPVKGLLGMAVGVGIMSATVGMVRDAFGGFGGHKHKSGKNPIDKLL